ncbi:MAG: hypothetical protein COB50_02535 [Thiotrichales bacterium]|nr:MAG: hypothetical protein COB50_02535 [Thiotrichales bacterium]
MRELPDFRKLLEQVANCDGGIVDETINTDGITKFRDTISSLHEVLPAYNRYQNMLIKRNLHDSFPNIEMNN